MSPRKLTSFQPPHGSRGSYTSGFFVGSFQSRDGGDEGPDIEILVINLMDEVPPLPRLVRRNAATSHVHSSTSVGDRFTPPRLVKQILRRIRGIPRRGQGHHGIKIRPPSPHEILNMLLQAFLRGSPMKVLVPK